MSSHGRTEECPICNEEMNVFDNEEAQRLLDIFEETFNELTDEEKRKYLLDNLGVKNGNGKKEK